MTRNEWTHDEAQALLGRLVVSKHPRHKTGVVGHVHSAYGNRKQGYHVEIVWHSDNHSFTSEFHARRRVGKPPHPSTYRLDKDGYTRSELEDTTTLELAEHNLDASLGVAIDKGNPCVKHALPCSFFED